MIHSGDLCDAGWEGAEPGQDFDQLSEEDLRWEKLQWAIKSWAFFYHLAYFPYLLTFRRVLDQGPTRTFLFQHNFSLQFLRAILEDFEESSEKKPTKVFLLNKFCNCGSCSNPILHYFPLSVCLCVCVQAWHLNFIQLFDDLGPTPLLKNKKEK